MLNDTAAPPARPTAETVWFLDNRVTFLAEGPGWSLVELAGHPGDCVPLHLHADEEEVFHVLEGALELHVGGHVDVLPAGRQAVAPRGVPHSYRVTADAPARWLVLASDTFGAFIRSCARPAGDGLPPRSGPPSPEQVAALTDAAGRHGIEILGPPPFAG